MAEQGSCRVSKHCVNYRKIKTITIMCIYIKYLIFNSIFTCSTDGTESPILAEDGGDGHDKPRLRYGELVILG